MKLNDVVDENTIIIKEGCMIYSFIMNRIIDNLTWNKGENFDYLTLKEIADQVCLPVRVISDSGLDGKIYEYNNYNDKKWYLYGITKGYA